MMKFMEDSSYMMSFTRYPRPPAFHKRPGGQFVLTTIGAILIATSYPGYYMTYAYLNELHIYKLQKEEKPLGEEVRKYKRILAGLQKKMKELDEKIDGLKKIYDEKEKTLISVYRKKVYYRLKSNQLAAISDELSENMVHTNRIESVDDNFSITVIAKEDRDITGLIKNISEKYHNEIVNIDIKSISKEANSSFYSGVLKVDLK
jgi:DNA gyrase/topoisomerase IV subunit A